MEVKAEDEYEHLPPLEDPLWIESYAFNGYDPIKRIGIAIYTGKNPATGSKLETATLYLKNPLFFHNQERVGKGDALMLGSVKMEPLQLLKKWGIRIRDSFQNTENGVPVNAVEEVDFNLYFESHTQPYGFSTNRGVRYEQLGTLKGKVQIGEEMISFSGTGLRDHSWEIRNISNWGEWYWLMGCFESGEAVSLMYMKAEGRAIVYGWQKIDRYYEIHDVQISPVFLRDTLRECHMKIVTSKEELDLDVEVLSFVSFPEKLISFALPSNKRELRKSKVTENLVQLDEVGYGFMWCERTRSLPVSSGR